MDIHSAFYSPWILVIIIFINLSPTGDNLLDDFYEEGKKELQKGEWKEALNIWLKAKSAVGQQSGADPRIGFAFIDVVTRNEAKEYYRVANEMYFWGIKEPDLNHYHDTLQEELDRLKPIMSKGEADHLQRLLDERSSKFISQLAKFWTVRDPFPASPYNERLFEHWERIQYARKNFTIRQNTPYQTDDRGLIYVRFGEPAEIKQRAVSLNRIIDPASGTSIPLYNNVSLKAEIWYYRNLMKEESSTSFVFGRPGSGGPFGLQPGILSLVPVSGNRISNYYDDQKVLTNAISQSNFGGSAGGTQYDESGGGTFAPPGYTQVSREGAELMLKYAVLEEIGAIDPFYNQLYNSMTQDIIRASMSNRKEKFTQTAESNLNNYNNKEISMAMLRDRAVPSNATETKKELEHFTVNRKILRFLDDEFKTIYVLATEAVDYEPLLAYVSMQSGRLSRDEILQLNTLYEYDNDWKLIREQPHILPLNKEGHFGKGVYYFEEETAGKSILFSSQYLDKKPATNSERLHEKLNAYIIASSEAEELTFPTPITFDHKQQVHMSDILLADPQEEDLQQRVPFVPNLDHIFHGEAMLVYFEVYNIPKGQDYQVEYTIEGLDNKQRTKKTGWSIIFNSISNGDITSNWFEVPLTDLPEYEGYRLSLTVKSSGTTIHQTKEAEFKVKPRD